MKIKRFFAPDVRQAMRKVKDELGLDAVILSNRRVNGGVEIIAATDYDEAALVMSPELMPDEPKSEPTLEIKPKLKPEPQPEPVLEIKPEPTPEPVLEIKPEPAPVQPAAAQTTESEERNRPQVVWQQESTLVEMRSELQNMRGLLEGQLARLAHRELQEHHPLQFELKRRLARLGFGVTLSEKMLQNLPKEGNVDELWRRLLGKVALHVPVTNDDILTQGGVVALVGATGVGKTTTVAKLAARFAMRHGVQNVALISTDNFRIGAHEQLRIYSRILDVPVRFVDSAESLQAALDSFCDKRLVLIDTAGMGLRDLRLARQFAVFKGERERIKPYLVVSATSRLSGLEEVIRSFREVKPLGCILTKTDESTSLGQILDLVMRHKLPLAYVSDGQRVPEDLQPARAHTLVSRAVALMQENMQLLDNELPGLWLGEVGS